MKILVVDDDAPARQSLEVLLDLNGFAVQLAASPEEALAQIDPLEIPDVIVSDFDMPGLNGVEFLEQATDQIAALGCPAPGRILLTGAMDLELPEDSQGEYRVVSKSNESAELLRVIQTLRQHSASAE